jgi:hypothetical protein
MSNKKVTNGRKNTPDILANLMGSVETPKKQEVRQAIKPESHKVIPKKPVMTKEPEINHKAIKAAQQQESNKTIMDAGKEKTTFNLSTKTLDALGDAWIKLRRKLKGEQRVTKTLIVEKAIEIVLADFESKSEMSELYEKLKS